jgi:nucleotide-binding universal stress UspA family protein
MELPKRILVPVDFTSTSERALDYAVDLARQLGASVTVLHAYEIPVLGFPDGALVATADVASRLSLSAQSALDGVLEARSDRGVTLLKELRQDVPWEAINAVAEEINADLIIIGTHGRRGLARALLGSVAENVIRTSTRPVLTIRGPRED